MRKIAFSLISFILILSAAAEEKIRIACVGDSITFGAGVENRKENNYPLQLEKILGEKYQVINCGVSGRTLLKKGDHPIWKEKAYQKAKDFKPNIVVIKLGTNDTKPQNWKYKDEFKNDLIAMVKDFQSLESKPAVYLCKPVPVYQSRWGINEEGVVKGVIPIVEEVAKELNLEVIDLYAALSNKPKMFPDKIHPNAAGAKVMAETVAKAVKK